MNQSLLPHRFFSLLPQGLCIDISSSLTTLSSHLHILNRSQVHLDSLNKAFPGLLIKVPFPSFVPSYLSFWMQNTIEFLQLCDFISLPYSTMSPVRSQMTSVFVHCCPPGVWHSLSRSENKLVLTVVLAGGRTILQHFPSYAFFCSVLLPRVYLLFL